MKKGRLIVVSGFSGAGKGTVIKRLREKYDYSLSISATTRAPREGEEDGREYYFKTVDEFMSEIAAGKNVILEIEVQGAMNIKSQYPDAILIFISTKDIDTLRERLTNRGTETPEVINKRIARAAEEAKSMESYEYIVINDDLEECVDTVNSIVVSQSCKKENRTEFLIGIKRQLDEM